MKFDPKLVFHSAPVSVAAVRAVHIGYATGLRNSYTCFNISCVRSWNGSGDGYFDSSSCEG